MKYQLRSLTVLLLTVATGALAGCNVPYSGTLRGTRNGGGTTTTTRPVTTTRPPSTTTPIIPPNADGKPPVPATGALVGAWLGPRRPNVYLAKDEVKALWARREADAGRSYDIAQEFYPFTSAFPSWREQWQIDKGRIPLVSWGGADTSAVVAGTYDDVFRARARGLRDLRSPVFLRWFGEMNGRKKQPLAIDPDHFIAAWRRVRRIFAAEGATNVAFVWCPTVDAFDAGRADAWYPGDDAVDWVCADGYNWNPAWNSAAYNPFKAIFAKFNAWGTAKGKPMMIGEFGALEKDPGMKAAWIAAAEETLKTRYTGIKAVVYYDENKGEDGTSYDWRLDTSGAAYSAWNGFVRDPWFRTRR